jgi:NADPH2:quinone reductase
MKAVGLYRYLPIEHPDSLVDVELPAPTPSGRDVLVEAGTLRTTMTANLGRISAPTVKRAHALLEAGHVIGKLVLEGF